jgi:NAD(P)-dependent dehydrogenase (short-subunit alcohol dehydrogenase family)
VNIEGICTLVTGGASGLGRATAELLISKGARVVILDLPTSQGEAVAAELGNGTKFAAADVTDEAQVLAAIAAVESMGPLRATVHCAGRGHTLRVLDRDGIPGSLEAYEGVIRTNLIGSFNVLRLSAASMARNQVKDGDRGIVIMTASVAAYEGQIGQIPYASSKAGVVGMTIVAARDLASKAIRVCTIAPGIFDTPLLARLSDDVRAALGKAVPHPARLGHPSEFALTASQIIENPVLNGETIRLDGALRMGPR